MSTTIKTLLTLFIVIGGVVGAILVARGSLKTPEKPAAEKNQLPSEENTFVYQNSSYNFSVALPPSWRMFDVVESGKDPVVLAFSFPQSGTKPIAVLNIYIFNKNDWDEEEKAPTKLKENSNYVYAYDYSPECVQHNEFQCERAKEVPEIIKTFKLVPATP